MEYNNQAFYKVGAREKVKSRANPQIAIPIKRMLPLTPRDGTSERQTQLT